MKSLTEGDVTKALGEIRSGDAEAKERLARLIYEELRRMAVQAMRQERPEHTFQPSDLAGEVFLRLEVGDVFAVASNRRHLFGTATQAIYEILVDHARKRAARKRGGDRLRLPLDDVLDHYEKRNVDLLSLHEALEQLAVHNKRPADIVTLRFFGGYKMEAIAVELGISLRTVENDFSFARAWLWRWMTKDDEPCRTNDRESSTRRSAER